MLLAGSGLAGAYFAKTNLTDIKLARKDATVNFRWTSGTAASSLGTDGFSTRWSGSVEPKFSETYTFIATSRGGVRVWVNNALIIDAWSEHNLQENSGSLKLAGGRRYNIRIDYWTNGQSTPTMKLEWQSSRRTREIIPANRLYAYTIEKTKPTTPAHLRTTTTGNTSVTLAWDASRDSTAVVAYDVYVGSSRVGTTLANTTKFTRSGLAPQTGYSFSVQAIDASGNASPKVTTAVTTAAGPGKNTAPTTPTGLSVTSASAGAVSLSWNASSDDVAVTSYRVYRNGAKYASASGTSYTDNNVSPGSSYSYSVRSADAGGLFSPLSGAVTANTPASSSHDALSAISANDYDGASGVSVSGSDVTNLDDGDWIRFDNVNFSSAARSIKLNLALDESNRGGTIELRLDSVNGTLIGKTAAQPTGDWTTFRTQQFNVNSTSGTHDLFVIFKDRNGVANLRSLQFGTQSLVRIMPLGDSITQQSNNSHSYRYWLWKNLQDDGYTNIDFVGRNMKQFPNDDVEPISYDFDQNHEGRAGIRADEIASQVAGWMSANPADIVLLHAGTNDLEQSQSVSSTLNDIANIITAIRDVNPNVVILLAKIIPEVGIEASIDELNSQLSGVAAGLSTGQSPVVLVDQNTGFSTSNLIDGVHPNDTGDALMAAKWEAALIPFLQ